MKNTFKYITGILVLLFIIGLVFSPILENSFIDNWDDNTSILDNNDIRELSIENIKNWFSNGYSGMYQPVPVASFAINYAIGQYDAFGYHFLSLVLHFLISLLLFQLLFKLSGDFWISVIATLFFVVHPFVVEPMTWVSGRSTLLSVLFVLLCLNYYVSGGRNFIILLLLYLLAVLSEVNTIFLPILLLGIDIGLINQNRPLSYKNLLPKVGMLLIALPVLIISFSFRPVQNFPFWEQIAYSPLKFLWYLNHLLPVYDNAPAYNMPALLDWRNLVGLMFIALASWIFYRSDKENKKIIIAGLLILIIGLAPYMMQFSLGAPVSDRYGYVALLGISIILVAILKFLRTKKKSGWVFSTVTAAMVCISIFNAFSSSKYSKEWVDEETLWEYAIEAAPDNYFAHNKLGVLMYKNGNTETAKVELLKAISLDPNDFYSHFNMGALSFGLKSYHDAAKYFGNAYEINKDESVLLNRARSYYALKDYENAINDLNRYLAVYPKGDAFYLRGLAKMKSGIDGCSDLKLALNMGINQALAHYAKDCLGN